MEFLKKFKTYYRTLGKQFLDSWDGENNWVYQTDSTRVFRELRYNILENVNTDGFV